MRRLFDADMAATAERTTSPERSAPARVRSTSCPTSSARWAVSLTVVVTSSTAAAVCSTEAAWCSVRLARSSAEARISAAPALMALALSPTVRSAACNLSTESLKLPRKLSRRGAKGRSSRKATSPLASAVSPFSSSAMAKTDFLASLAFSASVFWRSTSACSRIGGVPLHPGAFNRGILEDQNGLGHPADFVAAIHSGDFDLVITRRQASMASVMPVIGVTMDRASSQIRPTAKTRQRRRQDQREFKGMMA